MQTNIEMELPDEQPYFRPGRGTADMLVIIQVLIEKLMGIGSQEFVTFIDYSKTFGSISHKTFDSIGHEQVFDIMLGPGFPEQVVAL